MNGRELFAYFSLFILSFGLYFESIHFGYVLDDVIVLSENSFVQKGIKGIWNILSNESFTGYFGEQKDLVTGARYRPLSLVSFAIEFEFFGNAPNISHLMNIILYAIIGCSLFFLFKILIPNLSIHKWYWSFPFIASCLFIAHPIHSEAVANIKGRDEILSLLFSILTLISWIRFHDTGRKFYQFSAIILFLLAIFSKENAVTFIAIIPLTMWLFRSQNLTKSFIKSWPLFLCFLFFIVVRWQVIGYFLSNGIVIDDLMNNPFVGMKFSEKIATIFYTIIWYFKLLLFPHPLTHDYYPYHVPRVGFNNPIAIISIALTIILLYIAFYFRTKNKVISYSILFYFITFSIVSNFIFPVGTFMNERFLFMPSVAFNFLCGYYLFQLSTLQNPLSKWTSWTLSILLLTAYSVKTISRVPDWKNGFSLNLSAVNVSKNSARINLFTGVSYFQKYQPEDNPQKKFEYLSLAETYIDKSLAIFPAYGQALNMKAGVLAEWLKKDNDIKKFLVKLESVIKVKPNLDFVTKYMDYLTKDPENNNLMFPYLKHVGYDVLYKETRNYEYALHFLGLAYKINDQDADLNYYISCAYRDMARFGKLNSSKIQEYESKAKVFLDAAKALDPKYAK
ncbi:MAG: hypothetical protein WAS55_07230 [Saprospiraceae bacterium]